jgi:hypothetical protein
MRGTALALWFALGACGSGSTASDAGSDATVDANGNDAAPLQHGACTFTVEGAEQADGSCEFAMIPYFGALPDFIALWAGDSGVGGSIFVGLPRKGFAPGTYSATDFEKQGQAVSFNGVKDPLYSVDVGPAADGSVSLQLTSVDPYPTDTNLYGHFLPAPNTHGSVQAVLNAGPLYDLDAGGQQIPQDATVTLHATF